LRHEAKRFGVVAILGKWHRNCGPPVILPIVRRIAAVSIARVRTFLGLDFV
jgi:hypothetical protein